MKFPHGGRERCCVPDGAGTDGMISFTRIETLFNMSANGLGTGLTLQERRPERRTIDTNKSGDRQNSVVIICALRPLKVHESSPD